MKIALVYDRVNKWGGAERVLLALNELFPQAPLYTSVYSKRNSPWADIFPKVIPSFLQKLTYAHTRHEKFPFLMPHAFESFDFSGYDLVISVSSEAAKGVITNPTTKHISYCLTPTRYLWSGYEEYFTNKHKKLLAKPVIAYLRKWDKIASSRPDHFIAISSVVQARIKKYYARDSKIIHPPVDIDNFSFNERVSNKQKDAPFLIVSRLVPYKKVDLAVETFNKLGEPLIIVGTGGELTKLKKKAQKNIRFKSNLSDKELAKLYKKSRALIFAQEEDFGIVAVEAMASGVPVIAFKKGGAIDIVEENKTGIFFEEQKFTALANAVEKFAKMKFDSAIISAHAKKFSKERFQKEFLSFINSKT